MRILITTFTFPPQANGVSEVAAAQAYGLARRGHQVTVATSFDPARENWTCPHGIQIREFKLSGGAREAAGSPEEVKRFQTFIREFAADVMVCHSFTQWSTDLAAPVWAGNPARKVLVSHGFVERRWNRHSTFPWGLGQWLRTRLYTSNWLRLVSCFDHVVFLSEREDSNRFFDHKMVSALGRPGCSVIPNGCDSELLAVGSSDFRAWHQIGDALLILSVAAFHPNKGQVEAVRAGRQAGLDNAVLVLMGNEVNDYAREALQQGVEWSRAFPRSRVLLLEKQSREQIRAAYRAADVFLMPSKTEAQPLVLLDAMAAGKPFVATPVGCVEDLPGGLVGVDAAALAAHLKTMASDVELRFRLGAAGREACLKSYNWESVLDAYEALFRLLAPSVPVVA